MSNSENYNSANREDEIDLGLFFRKIGDIFINILFAFYKRILLITIIFITFICIGIFFYSISPNIYKSDIVLSSRYISKQRSILIINSLNKLLEENNPEDFASKMKISPSIAKNITKLEFAIFDQDTTKAYLAFKIKATVYNTNVLDTLEKALVNYFSSITYIKRSEEMEKSNLKNFIEKTKKEIESLEQLKKIAFTNLAPQGKAGFIYGQPYDPITVYKESSNLYQQVTAAENELANIRICEVIQGFIKTKRPAGPSIIKNLFYATITSLLISVILIILLELRISMKNKQQKMPIK